MKTPSLGRGERPQENETHQHLDARLLAPRTLSENKFLVFQPPSLWYFAMVALADYYRYNQHYSTV